MNQAFPGLVAVVKVWTNWESRKHSWSTAIFNTSHFSDSPLADRRRRVDYTDTVVNSDGSDMGPASTAEGLAPGTRCYFNIFYAMQPCIFVVWSSRLYQWLYTWITTPLVTRFGGGTSKCNSTILFCFPPPHFSKIFWKIGGGGKKVTSAADKRSNTGKTSKCNITFWRLTLKRNGWSVGWDVLFDFFFNFPNAMFYRR